jgi:hypothetical protein
MDFVTVYCKFFIENFYKTINFQNVKLEKMDFCKISVNRRVLNYLSFIFAS